MGTHRAAGRMAAQVRKRIENWYESLDRWHTLLLDFFLWRKHTFPWYYEWRAERKHRKGMMEKFGFVPKVGDRVEDCRGEVHTITEMDNNGDDVVLDDGFACSLWACCDLPKD